MDNRYSVRIMRSEINYLKNVNFGEITYMNHGSINTNGKADKTDVVGIYGQNGSGKTALVESLDILKYVLMGMPIPYDFAGIISKEEQTKLVTDFYIETKQSKYKVQYAVYLRVNEEIQKIEIIRETLVYWLRGSAWKSERDIDFENPNYDAVDLLDQEDLTVKSNHAANLKSIPFLWAMQKLALICSQRHISVFFNTLVSDSCKSMKSDEEAINFSNIIHGLMKFGMVDLNVIRIEQLGQINSNIVIPINGRSTTENTITQSRVTLYIAGESDIDKELYNQVTMTIDAINTALKSIIPDLQIELDKTAEFEKPDGKKAFKVNIYSKRGGKKFPFRYESEGIKRIISILNYLISAFNESSVCLVVDELDSGIFEYLLGELLGLMHKEMKGQLIFTSHNLRILEKLDAKNIICTTTNPDNRYIRMVGIEKNHNKRDYYIRALTVGGQKEDLYDEDDLIAMGYAFRKAGNPNNRVTVQFSPQFEEDLHKAN